MKDFAGIELEVGDEVIFTSSNHLFKGLYEGTVIKVDVGVGKRRATLRTKSKREINVMSNGIMKLK